jgi:DNA-binding LacI/PurR family transcriptional regulator
MQKALSQAFARSKVEFRAPSRFKINSVLQSPLYEKKVAYYMNQTTSLFYPEFTGNRISFKTSQIVNAVLKATENEIRATLMETLFLQSLTNKDVTAWVFDNDYQAVAALDFLQKKHVAVPGSLSVCGFDDTAEGFSAGLASYSFKPDLLAQWAVEWVCSNGSSRLIPANAREPQGVVIPRQTLGYR